MAEGGDLDEVLKEFLVESHENLDQMDRDFVALEKDPSSRELLGNVFRTIHTLKGTCGFLGFGKLEGVSHVAENLLSRLRDGELLLTPEITSALLATVDAIRIMLAEVESTASDGDEDYASLVALLTKLGSGEPAGADASQLAAVSAETIPASDESPEGDESAAGAALATALPSEPIALAPAAPSAAATTAVAPEPSAAASAANEPAGAARAGDGGASAADSSIRVDVGLLDKLMNLAGELVLARNQILQFAAAQDDTAFLTTTQALNLITTELQEGVMKTRMQPIRNVWNKFPRVVRDLAVVCHKRARLEMEGADTELDKTIIEAIKDPMTHIVRNSVDHGIEPPDVRLAAGKPGEGRVFLRAYHEGGQVNIEISDDGGGIDPERVRQKALQRGLVTAEQAARMTERQILNLILLPGFSTAETITNVSGRGVGMDVVKTNVEKIGGTLDVQSRVGHGTTLKIKIPLTLAIIPALIVTSGPERFAIPQVSLLELVRLEGEQARKGIERIKDVPVYRLRGNLLPLVYLDQALELEGPPPLEDGEEEVVNIVVLQTEDRQFGLVVGGVNDTEEIVVKPLGKMLKSVSTFAGATIMGDGRVALILDVLGIGQRAGVVGEVRDRSMDQKEDEMLDDSAEHQSLLVFLVGEDRRMAIPLSLVARLEEFSRDLVETSGGDRIVQYRGQIMPLVDLSSIYGGGMPRDDGDEPLKVVVHVHEGRSVGLVVDQILDIVDEAVTSTRDVHRDGILGSVVIQQKVTDLIDVKSLVVNVLPPVEYTETATNEFAEMGA